MPDRLSIVKAGLKQLPRSPGERLRSMSWLAAELGVSRQMLYQVLRGEERSTPLEGRLSEMFLDLPKWPPLAECDFTGAVPIRDYLRR